MENAIGTPQLAESLVDLIKTEAEGFDDFDEDQQEYLDQTWQDAIVGNLDGNRFQFRLKDGRTFQVTLEEVR